MAGAGFRPLFWGFVFNAWQTALLMKGRYRKVFVPSFGDLFLIRMEGSGREKFPPVFVPSFGDLFLIKKISDECVF